MAGLYRLLFVWPAIFMLLTLCFFAAVALPSTFSRAVAFVEAHGAEFLFCGFMLLAYLAPAIEAERRDHHRRQALLGLNLLLGWTVIGWIIAAVWSQADADCERL